MRPPGVDLPRTRSTLPSAREAVERICSESSFTEPMRILLLTDKFIPERGGSQIILAEEYGHLPEHEVTVVTREFEGDQEADKRYHHPVHRVPYSRVPKLRSPLLWLSIARRARQLLQSGQFDQIHCGQTVETAPVGAWLARRFGLPLVMHTFAEDVTTYLRHPFYLPMMRYALRHASVVTSISQFTVEHLRKLGVPPERIVLLYPGLDPERWVSRGGERGIRARFGLEGRPVVITVSRLIPRKGQDMVLRALPEVLKVVPDLVYLIVGGGPEEPRLRRLATELALDRHVRFVGSIPNHEAPDYYYASDVFAMPNREMPNGDIEGFGLVFLEANMCGLPVIGGRSGGAVDAIEHERTGYLVDPISPGEISRRLIDLLSDPGLRQRMGDAGRRRVEEQFTWSAAGQTLHRAVALAGTGH